jgi:hypothetical protein
MTMIYIYEDQEFDGNQAITLDNQYPAGWFDDATNRAHIPVFPLQENKPVVGSFQTAVRAGQHNNHDGTWSMDWIVQNWDAAQIDAYKAEKGAIAWENIKANRDARKSLGVNVGGVWFHSDTDSRIQWLGLKDDARDILAAGGNMGSVLQKLGQNVMWKPMGSYNKVPATVQLAFDVVAAVGNLDAMLFYIADQHRVAALASNEPHLYDFSAGWPAHFIS